jgi:hypothetical protein
LSVLESDRPLDPNPQNRCSVGTNTPDLVREEDGSVTIHLQPESPGKERASNWLPSPRGRFDLILHTYGGRAVPQYFRSWLPLAVRRVGAPRESGGVPRARHAATVGTQ